jgi:hypothetical protein
LQEALYGLRDGDTESFEHGIAPSRIASGWSAAQRPL